MTIIPENECEQGSVEWMRLRLGRVTASGIDAILTTKWAFSESAGMRTYLYKRIAEKLTGYPADQFSTKATEAGQILEPEAIPSFELDTNLDVQRVGFVIADDGRTGCSPDGLVGDDDGLEIKCPLPHTHVGYLVGGVLPDTYRAQVHASLWVTGRKRWHFYSYCRKLPALHVVVERDEEIMNAITEALAKFYALFDSTLEKLK